MKIIENDKIVSATAELIDHALKNVEQNTCALISKALGMETSEPAKWALEQILCNADLAAKTCSYACQDCGLALVFVELGIGVQLTRPIEDSVNEGVILGYKNARKSACDPLSRTNTGNNAPAVIYVKTVSGDSLRISYLAKGAGSENMSRIYMLTPSKGRQGIIDSVVDCVKIAGANPCPPLVIGVGVGGTMDKAAVISKVALLRETGAPSANPDCAALERDILERVNQLGIGAQGLGGLTTALAVHVESYPTHIGMLPVAVTVQCHSVRHGSVLL